MTKKNILLSAAGFACAFAVCVGAVLLIKGQGREQALENDTPPMDVEIPAGIYYHVVDGVKDEDFYIDVTDDKTIQVVYDDVTKCDLSLWDEFPEEERAALAEANNEEYLRKNDFITRYIPEIDYTGIFIHWNIDDNGSFGGYGYCYAAENTITWGGAEGEFVLE